MNDARELACLLKKVDLKTSEVKVGYVIVKDYGVFPVTSISEEEVPDALKSELIWKNATHMVLLHGEEDIICNPSDSIVTCLDPSIFNEPI